MSRAAGLAAYAIMVSTTAALTMVILFREEVPRWQGWVGVGVPVLILSLMAYLSSRRAALGRDLMRIDEEMRREDALEDGRTR